MKKYLAMILACLTVGMCMVGCGDSDDSDGGTSSSKKKSSKTTSAYDDKGEASQRAKEAIGEFFKCYENEDIDGIVEYVIPSEMIDDIKDTQRYQKYLAGLKKELGNYYFEFESVTYIGELTSNQLKKLENAYFEHAKKKYDYDLDIDISEGCRFKVKLRSTEKESGDSDIDTEEFLLVYIEDDGWKVPDPRYMEY